MFIIMLFCAVILYFFVFRWHRYKESDEVKFAVSDSNDKFKRNIYSQLSV